MTTTGDPATRHGRTRDGGRRPSPSADRGTLPAAAGARPERPVSPIAVRAGRVRRGADDRAGRPTTGGGEPGGVPPGPEPEGVAPGPTPAGVGDRLAGRLLRALAARAAVDLQVVDGGPGTGPAPPFSSAAPAEDGRRPATVVVHDPRAYGAVLRRGSVGLGEAYVAGWWDADDLAAAVGQLIVGTAGWRRVLDAAGRAAGPVLALPALARAARGRLRPQPAMDGDRADVQAHYDLPHDLFAAMLDETMAYSCAVFEHPGASLTDAQRAKFDRLCGKLRLGPGDHVVEIGTGWGGFAIHAAATYGCRVTTTTVSEAQRAVATERVQRAGLAERVTVLDEDYRELGGRFDALVSIEMVEAVDWHEHHTYLRACRRLVGDEGRVGLQAIVLDDASEPRARHHADFIRAMVFPGSCIPSVSRLVTQAARAGLRTVDVEDIGRHYAETLRRWRVNLAAAVHGRPARSDAEDDAPVAAVPVPEVDVALLRLWELYLAYCEAAFLERHISDVQLVLAPGGWRQRLDPGQRSATPR